MRALLIGAFILVIATASHGQNSPYLDPTYYHNNAAGVTLPNSAYGVAPSSPYLDPSYYPKSNSGVTLPNRVYGTTPSSPYLDPSYYPQNNGGIAVPNRAYGVTPASPYLDPSYYPRSNKGITLPNSAYGVTPSSPYLDPSYYPKSNKRITVPERAYGTTPSSPYFDSSYYSRNNRRVAAPNGAYSTIPKQERRTTQVPGELVAKRLALTRAIESDRRLNQGYKLVRAQLSAADREELKALQIQWLEMRDSEVMDNDLLAKGMSADTAALVRLTKLNQQRVAIFEQLVGPIR